MWFDCNHRVLQSHIRRSNKRIPRLHRTCNQMWSSMTLSRVRFCTRVQQALSREQETSRRLDWKEKVWYGGAA